MQITFGVRHLELDTRRFCIDWTITYTLDFSYRAQMVGTLDISDKCVLAHGCSCVPWMADM